MAPVHCWFLSTLPPNLYLVSCLAEQNSEQEEDNTTLTGNMTIMYYCLVLKQYKDSRANQNQEKSHTYLPIRSLTFL